MTRHDDLENPPDYGTLRDDYWTLWDRLGATEIKADRSFRLLFNGDIIGEGCESLQDDAQAWIPTESAFWGTRYTSEFFRPMRMPNAQDQTREK